MQSHQFSCVSNGAIYRVEITEEFKNNIIQAYLEYDQSTRVVKTEKALFFTRGTFNRKYLFTDEVQHNFYK